MREAVFSFLKKMTENKFRRTPKNNVGFVIHKAALRRRKFGVEFFEGLHANGDTKCDGFSFLFIFNCLQPLFPPP